MIIPPTTVNYADDQDLDTESESIDSASPIPSSFSTSSSSAFSSSPSSPDIRSPSPLSLQVPCLAISDPDRSQSSAQPESSQPTVSFATPTTPIQTSGPSAPPTPVETAKSATSAPSPPSTPPQVVSLVSNWRISPHTLRMDRCPCVELKRKYMFNAAEEYVKFNLDRFQKVWLRVAHVRLYPKVRDGAERVFRELRGRGWELSHLVSRELSDPVAGVNEGAPTRASQRREISTLFLIPSADEETGHRPLAELLVHLSSDGKTHSRNKVENVAVRFQEDWEDWTVSLPHTYLRADAFGSGRGGRSDAGGKGVSQSGKDTTGKKHDPEMDQSKDGDDDAHTHDSMDAGENNDGKIVFTVPDKREGVSWDMILGNLLVSLQTLLEWRSVNSKEFRSVLTRTSSELRAEGKTVCGFEMENVYREIGRVGMVLPCIRIAVMVSVPSTRSSSSSHSNQQSTQEKSTASNSERPEQVPAKPNLLQPKEQGTGAVVLLDLSDLAKKRVKHISVIYEGEWPIAHVYKGVIPPPSLEGLEALVQE